MAFSRSLDFFFTYLHGNIENSLLSTQVARYKTEHVHARLNNQQYSTQAIFREVKFLSYFRFYLQYVHDVISSSCVNNLIGRIGRFDFH
jgi:hypothetical protein